MRHAAVTKSAAPPGKPSVTRPAGGRSAAQFPLRDAERTKRAILKAATAEFTENGLAGARVDQIAEMSGVNKRMIYYYFNSKDDLYLAVLEAAYTAMRAAEAQLNLDLEPLAAIRTLVEFKFDYFVENPSMIWLLNGENMLGAEYLKRSTRLKEMHISLVRRIETILEAGVAAGTIRRKVDPLQLYISISGLSYFFFSNGPTLSIAFGKELRATAARKARRAHVVEVILDYLRPRGEGVY